MTGHVKDGGVWKEAQGIHIKDGGVWKEVQEAFVKDGGVWKFFFTLSGPPMSAVNLNATSFTGTKVGGQASTTVTTSLSSVATPVGGGPVYTYNWVRVSGTILTVVSQGTASTRFSSVVPNGGSASAVYRCDVTSNGVTVSSANISITLNFFDSGT